LLASSWGCGIFEITKGNAREFFIDYATRDIFNATM